MKPVTFFIILLFVAAMGSSLFLVGGKKESAASSSVDSSNAYATDNIAVVDSIRRDTVSDELIFRKNIDTKNVSPEEVVAFAKTLIGIPYKYGSTDPRQGFDCSGFFTYVFRHFNITVPRSSIDFMDAGKKIQIEKGKKGDLILFTGTDSTEKFAGHMGMIVSNENGVINFIHSTSGSHYGVTITGFNDYYRSRYLETIRIFPQND